MSWRPPSLFSSFRAPPQAQQCVCLFLGRPGLVDSFLLFNNLNHIIYVLKPIEEIQSIGPESVMPLLTMSASFLLDNFFEARGSIGRAMFC